ncbi:MAG: cobalamin biosynthesis protein [Candidatus Faecousia sp.]|nr:cobalamin biosynthesis protein [Candidatus Faecousia sp.]
MKIALFAYSRQGCRTARRVLEHWEGEEIQAFTMERFQEPGFEPIRRPSKAFYGPLFDWADTMLFIGSCGIAVREIAPHVKSKLTDPAVIAVDELARFAVPVLSGHIGGANALALELADFLGATPVITTATDIHRKFSVDAWAASQGLHIASLSAVKHVSARILEATVPICSDFPMVTPLPGGTVEGASGEIGICISARKREPFDETLLLVPPVLHLGIGCRQGIPCQTIEEAVNQVCRGSGIHPKAIRQVASIDLKADEAGLLEFCEKWGLSAVFYSAGELQAVPGEFTASERVLRVTGVDNVCERAAMVGAEKLLVRKTAMDGVTVAIAQEHWEVRFE